MLRAWALQGEGPGTIDAAFQNKAPNAMCPAARTCSSTIACMEEDAGSLVVGGNG